MPITESADGVGHALQPAAHRTSATANDEPALPIDNPLEEGLIAGFLLSYQDRTRAAYLADLRNFHTC
jgi:hypothetical protein